MFGGFFVLFCLGFVLFSFCFFWGGLFFVLFFGWLVDFGGFVLFFCFNFYSLV